MTDFYDTFVFFSLGCMFVIWQREMYIKHVFCILSTLVSLSKTFSNRSEKVVLTDNPFYVDLS